jgi:thiamine-phosphate pyrophosphorylase
MDQQLLAWARAVKQRQGGRLPVLWLFTDATRLPDPLPAVRALPKGCGVVLRHDGAADRLELGFALARICRARRLALVVAGDARLAARLGAGMHLRDGRWPGVVRLRRGLVTSSAHGGVALRRARGAGADVAFLSPAFATASHAGARALGPVRWARLARGGGVYALGGVTGANVVALGRRAAGAGAIGALMGD